MSIFDSMYETHGHLLNTKLCTYAAKNISKTDEYKFVNMNILLQEGDQSVEIAASFAMNRGNQVSVEIPVKMVVKVLDSSGDSEDPTVLIKDSFRAFRPEDVTKEMLRDIQAASILFEEADKDVQRVFM